jgi:23S rRNA (pseudouridine1915-N3)-methyltransferase
MRLTFTYIGKTDLSFADQGIKMYSERVARYTTFREIIIPDVKNRKNLSEFEQKQKEAQSLLSTFTDSEEVWLLDEKGLEMSSIEFSEFLQKKMNSGIKGLNFVVGGPYGFSDAVYARANGKISLSKMTFSHQMVRMFFLEQLYRAFTIIKGEPYHHR